MNIALRIENWAQKTPDKTCLKFPVKTGSGYKYDQLSFKAFNDLSSHYAACLNEEGIQKGDKVLLFVKPSCDFPALTFALFKLGAIPILIDPGMGLKNLFKAIKDAKPDYLIAVNIVHILRLFKKDSFKTSKKYFTTESKILSSLTTISSLRNKEHRDFSTQEVAPQDLAAILFTSGGTGRPKGVEYTHEIFNRQTDVLQELFNLTAEDIDVPGFPLFSFFTMSMGMTSVIPDMNPSKPAKCDPEALIKNINDNKATFVAGSPAIW
ncbi:AMP-binding protein, partial [Halobacteriovorax sp. Y22]|uniref:AMP-binding protein n=1 Tax=Halobacteriovorax sp. Y22 TaxID=2505978 RepID=UPI0011003702